MTVTNEVYLGPNKAQPPAEFWVEFRVGETVIRGAKTVYDCPAVIRSSYGNIPNWSSAVEWMKDLEKKRDIIKRDMRELAEFLIEQMEIAEGYRNGQKER